MAVVSPFFLRQRHAVAAVLASLALVAGLSLAPASPAFADEFPTWEEVQEARKDVAKAQAKVKEIQELLAGLEQASAEAEQEAARLGEIYYEALFELDEATFKPVSYTHLTLPTTPYV